MKGLKHYLPSLLILTVLLGSAGIGVTVAKYATQKDFDSSLTISADIGTLYFEETPVQQDATGAYVKAGNIKVKLEGDTDSSKQTYYIIPGVNIPKDTALVVTKKDATPAYVYMIIDTNISSKEVENDIAVIANLRRTGVEHSGCWTALHDVTSDNNSIYVYHASGLDSPAPVTLFDNDVSYSLPLLAGAIIEVRENAKLYGDQTELTLNFSAYMYQAITVTEGDTTRYETAEETWLRNHPTTP